MGQVFRRKKALCLFWTLVILVAVGWHVYPANIYAAGKGTESQEEKSDEIRAYEEFLNGKRRVFIEKEMGDLFEDADFLTEEMLKSGALLQDILKQVNEFFCEDEKMGTLEYAYLDLCRDGKLELAVRTGDLMPLLDNDNWTFIIVYEDGQLFLRHAFEAWSRNRVDLYYYGYLLTEGSGGMSYSCFEEEFINHTGKACFVYKAERYFEDLGKQIFGEEGVLISEKTYTIQDKEYPMLEPRFEKVDAAKWEEFRDSYEQEYGAFYTEEEIEQFIQNQWKSLGIKESWLEKKELDWQLLENGVYREYVREIDLMETRKEQHAGSRTILNNKWVTCKSEKYDITSHITHDYLVEDQFWCYAIEYCLSDYCEKSGIPEGTWTLKRIVSYGDEIFAAALTNDHLEATRDLYLLFDSDALKMKLGEYTQYIVAVDFQHGSGGQIAKYAWSYDSMLDWDSYQMQTLKDAENPYTVRKTEDSSSYFTGEGRYALNQYLKDRHADTKGIWELDVNAMCSVGNIVALRYICGKQEVVILLDTANETFAIAKELNGRKQFLNTYQEMTKLYFSTENT
ncbi:MAG: hypothetical protein K2N15_14690 [Lachnospiraceae bacterium]|nr:hypothetical protein [Lachnospiraceae bacterium]